MKEILSLWNHIFDMIYKLACLIEPVFNLLCVKYDKICIIAFLAVVEK